MLADVIVPDELKPEPPFKLFTSLSSGGVTLELDTTPGIIVARPFETVLYDVTAVGNNGDTSELASWIWKDEHEARMGHMVVVSELRSGRNPMQLEPDELAAMVKDLGASFAMAVVSADMSSLGNSAPEPFDVAQDQALDALAANYGLSRTRNMANTGWETDVELRERIKAVLEPKAYVGNPPKRRMEYVSGEIYIGGQKMGDIKADLQYAPRVEYGEAGVADLSRGFMGRTRGAGKSAKEIRDAGMKQGRKLGR